MGEQIVFGFAAAAAVFSSVLVITLRSPFRAAVALIGSLVSVAVIFLLLAAPFVAAIQVIVYAGAIVVLFLFVIAYLGDRVVLEAADRLGRYQAVAWLVIAGVVAQGVVVITTSNLPGLRGEPRPVGDIGSPEAIGRSFIDRYIVPFEATSLVLLVAAVGAVLLAKKAVQSEGGR